jgi:signal transduction histidine kinase
VETKGFVGAWVAVPEEDGRVSLAASAGRLGGYLERLRITLDLNDPRGDAPTARALRDARTTYIQDFLADGMLGYWRDLAAEYNVRAMAALPLRRGGQVVAALVFYADRANAFPQRVQALLEQVAGNVSFGLEALAAGEQLREVAAQRAELMQRVVTAQESERVRIAGDIHDESVQALAAIDLRLGLLKGRLRDSAPELEPSVSQIQETLTTAIGGLRSLLFELEPADLEGGLLAAIEETATRVFEQHHVGWQITTRDGVDLSGLTAIEQTQLLRIVKESLVNVRKHSSAENVEITVGPRDGGVEFVVADDGVGVDPEDIPRRSGHRGLQTMRDRAAVVGGWLELERGADGGMAVRLWMPASAGTRPTSVPPPVATAVAPLLEP